MRSFKLAMHSWPILLLALLLTACSSPRDEAQQPSDESSDAPMSGMMGDNGMGPGIMADSMPAWMMSADGMQGMMQAGMMQEMRVIHTLLTQHELIERHLEDIPRGVRTTTTSDNPDVAEQIRTHVRQMKDRLEAGRPIRWMDPLFRELFNHHEQIHLEYEEIPGGARVTETSENPAVVALIRQHAHAFVSEVVDQGMQRAMRPTPLPEAFRP